MFVVPVYTVDVLLLIFFSVHAGLLSAIYLLGNR